MPQKVQRYINVLFMDMNNDGLQIELSSEVAEGTYANLAVIAHSTSEFVFDFIRMMPGVSKAKVNARVIMTPEHAKRLSMALEDNIKKYENQYGQIRVPDVKGYIPVSTFKGDA